MESNQPEQSHGGHTGEYAQRGHQEANGFSGLESGPVSIEGPHNFPGPDSDAEEKVVDVALRTGAAPTYFPIYQGYVDGGVVANNPSMCALAQALHPEAGGQKLEEVTLLSMGTGIISKYLPEKDSDWGLAQWAPHLFSIMIEGGVGLADYQCRQLLGERYLRIDPVLPASVGIDRLDEIPIFQEIGQLEDLRIPIGWLKRYYE